MSIDLRADMHRFTRVKREAKDEHEETLIPIALHFSPFTLHALWAVRRSHLDAAQRGCGARPQMDQELIGYLDRRLKETKRHFAAIAEEIDHKVQLVAEGVVNLGERLGQFREEMGHEFRETQAMIRFSYADLQRQIEDLRQRVSIVEERLGLRS